MGRKTKRFYFYVHIYALIYGRIRRHKNPPPKAAMEAREFIHVRLHDPKYLCAISFFKKDKITYGGDKLYWMLKEKICNNSREIILKHKSYNNNM